MEVTAACCACLATEDKLYSVEENNLQQALEDLTDLPVGISSLPLYLCYLCRALVIKFAAFRAAYRYTHLILLKEIRKGKVIHGEITQHEHNVRKNAGLLLTISETDNMDINSEVDREICTAGTNSEENNNENFNELEIKREITPESAVEYDVFDNIDDNNIENYRDLVLIVQNEHNYTMSDCASNTENEAGMENSQAKIKNDILENIDDDINIIEEFLVSDDANSDVWELDPRDELATFYGNKKNELTHSIKEEKDIIKNNEGTSETCTENNEKQNRNETHNEISTKSVDQQNKNIKTKKRYPQNPRKTAQEKAKIVFREPDKYTSKTRIKTLEAYEIFGKKYNVKIDFYITKEEQMNVFLARKETDNYKKGTYKCELCYIGFMTGSAYTNHMKKHEKQEKRRFMCEFCQRYFPSNSGRLIHLDGHRVKYTCLQCGESLTNSHSVVRHFKAHSGFTYECKKCLKSFRVKTTYYEHIRSAHGVLDNTPCSFCNETFNGPIGLKLHMQKRHPDAKDNFCASCGRQFSNEVARTTHEDCCSPDNSPCVRCGASFPSDERLAEHVAEDHKTTYVCPKCNKQFRSERNLVQHNCRANKRHIPHATRLSDTAKTKRKTMQNQKKLCDICGKIMTLTAYTYHKHLHEQKKTFQCGVCHKAFRFPASIKMHQRSHTGFRPYRCSACDKAFTQGTHLRRHMKTHSDERPVSCPLCPSRFKEHCNLREHTRVKHESLPPFERNRRHRKDPVERREI